MPLQNRVTPTGDIIATPHRGMFTGNRGIIHDPATRTLTRRWAGKAWLTCVCEFRGRRRKVMGGRRWTELFFLDEATALSAGHRPCAECRRGGYRRWQAAWPGPDTGADAMDLVLHADRLDGRGKRTHAARLGELPEGVLVERGGRPWLLAAGTLWP